MSTTYDTSWSQTSSPFARQPKKPSSMYSDPSQQTADQTSGMYSQPTAPIGGGLGVLDFSKLQAGGSQDVTSGDTSIRSSGPDQTGMYNAYTGLLGTGLQTEAQKAVANTQIKPQMEKLALQSGTYFPELMKMFAANGLGGGNSGMSSLISSVTNSANPAYEQAAINAAEAAAARSAEQSKLDHLRQTAGVSGSPFRYALDAASNAAAVGQSEDAKRKIRDDYAQRRVGNLASAVSAQSSSMNPLYSLFGSLLS